MLAVRGMAEVRAAIIAIEIAIHAALGACV